jgi:pilus assembly protein CpaE
MTILCESDENIIHLTESSEPTPVDGCATLGAVFETQVQMPGKVITIFSPKGGTGKTAIATNMAVALNANGAHRVCLLDLDLEFGDIAISLGLSPVNSLIDAVSQDRSGSMDDRVDALLTPWRRGLDCVLAPVNPGDAVKISSDVIADLVLHLRSRYDYVVIDTPTQLSEHVLEALDAADHHVLITTPEIPALKSMRLTLDTLDLLSYRSATRSIVLNQSDPNVGLTTAEAEGALSSPITALIPASPAVSVSINIGLPITLAEPSHPVSMAIRELAERAITGVPVTTDRRRRFGRKLRTPSI